MTKKERMLAALRRQPVDRIPRGELGIEGGFIQNFTADIEKPMTALQKEIYVREQLGFDFINIHEFPRKLLRYSEDGHPIYESPYGDVFKETPYSFQMLKPALEDIEDVEDYAPADLSVATTHLLDYYRENTDFFLMCQINGPVGALDWALGMEDYMCCCMTDTELIARLAEKIMAFEIGRAKLFLDHGAEAILIADDIAFNSGLLLPPRIMEQVAYPFYRKAIQEIKAHKDVPVILHTDGYMHDVIGEIIDCGFDAIQSIQPSAGMDIARVKREYGDRLCLIGNVDLNYLLPFGKPEEVLKEVRRLAEVAGPEGFVLSTCNILTDAVKIENARAMYLFDSMEDKEGGNPGRLVRQTVQYIHSNYRKAALKEAAAQAYVSPAYLSRVFIREMKESFSQYLLRFKMERAKELLRAPNCKIYEVAVAVGYSDASHFSKAFKQIEGCSPQEYRDKV